MRTAHKDRLIHSLQAADGFNSCSVFEALLKPRMYKHTNTNFAQRLSHQLKQTKQTDAAESEPDLNAL